MKKIILFIFLLIPGMLLTLHGADYKNLLTGQWQLVKINNRGNTLTVPADGYAYWQIKADGTGNIDMRLGERKKKIFFIWHILKNQLVTVDRDTKKKESLSFGFYDDFLVLIKTPDNTMLLQKIR